MVARTDEQVEADDSLTAAVERVLHAYAPESGLMDRYMPGAYVVVATHMGLRDGEEVSMTNLIFKDGDIPLPMAMGLIRYGQVQLDKFCAED